MKSTRVIDDRRAREQTARAIRLPADPDKPVTIHPDVNWTACPPPKKTPTAQALLELVRRAILNRS